MTQANRLTSDQDDVVYACPECDHAGDIVIRRGSNTHVGNPDDPYSCGKCSATFEEPVEREPKMKGRRPALVDLEPEDLGL